MPYLYGYSNETFADVSNELVQTLQLQTKLCKEDFKAETVSIPDISVECDFSWEEKSLEDWTNSLGKKYQDSIQCFACFASMKNIPDLQKHIEESKKCQDKNFFCQKCPKVFDLPIKVVRHSVVHKTDGKVFACLKCGKAFKSKRILTTHLSKVHGVHPDKAFKCQKCPKSFNFQARLFF